MAAAAYFDQLEVEEIEKLVDHQCSFLAVRCDFVGYYFDSAVAPNDKVDTADSHDSALVTYIDWDCLVEADVDFLDIPDIAPLANNFLANTEIEEDMDSFLDKNHVVRPDMAFDFHRAFVDRVH